MKNTTSERLKARNFLLIGILISRAVKILCSLDWSMDKVLLPWGLVAVPHDIVLPIEHFFT